MAIKITGTFEPTGSFPLAKAKDIDMGDGTRLDQLPETIPAQVDAALQEAKESGLFQGEDGADGKSAYEYAKAGGYTGTEAEFAELMAKGAGSQLESYSEAEGVGRVENKTDWDNELWTQWDDRLSFGMEPGNAPAPFRVCGQLFADGTIICRNVGDMKHNRWGFHLLEGYAKDNWSRMTVLVDKHVDDSGRNMVELYFYVGAAHTAASYGGVRVGSDVEKHSFVFDRDTMTAYGQADFKAPICLNGIDLNTDIDDTYETVADADAAYDPEFNSDANNKSLQYIRLANAKDGTMFYDEANRKIAIKIAGNWKWFAVKTPPAGTYAAIGAANAATIEWESGLIGGAGGNADNSARIRTVGYLPEDAACVEAKDGYLYTIVCLDDDGHPADYSSTPRAYYSPSAGGLVSGATYISEKVYFADVLANVGEYSNFRLIAKRSDSGEMVASEGVNIVITVADAEAEPELPKVAEADNGKFLRVVDGAWAAVSVESAEGASF